jgi:hypothetical protein
MTCEPYLHPAKQAPPVSGQQGVHPLLAVRGAATAAGGEAPSSAAYRLGQWAGGGGAGEGRAAQVTRWGGTAGAHQGPKKGSFSPRGEWKQPSRSTLTAPSRWAADTGTMKSPHVSAAPHTCRPARQHIAPGVTTQSPCRSACRVAGSAGKHRSCMRQGRAAACGSMQGPARGRGWASRGRGPGGLSPRGAWPLLGGAKSVSPRTAPTHLLVPRPRKFLQQGALARQRGALHKPPCHSDVLHLRSSAGAGRRMGAGRRCGGRRSPERGSDGAGARLSPPPAVKRRGCSCTGG